MRKTSWMDAALLTLVVVALGGAFRDARAQELPDGVTPEMVQEGREIFSDAGFCLSCHGETGEGTVLGPNLTDDEWLHIDGSYEAIIELINTGVPEPKEHMMPMVPRGGSDITDEQVRRVAAYVWTLSRNDGG